MMRTTNITPELRSLLLEALKAYLNAPPLPEGRTPVEIEAELNHNRLTLIEKSLRPLLTDFLRNSLSVGDFKRRVDGLNKQNNYWGFRGIKGQMFFNMLVNSAENEAELGNQLRRAVSEPEDWKHAARLLENFQSYVVRTGQHVADAGEARSKPKPSSIPFFSHIFGKFTARTCGRSITPAQSR